MRTTGWIKFNARLLVLSSTLEYILVALLYIIYYMSVSEVMLNNLNLLMSVKGRSRA